MMSRKRLSSLSLREPLSLKEIGVMKMVVGEMMKIMSTRGHHQDDYHSLNGRTLLPKLSESSFQWHYFDCARQGQPMKR